MENMEEIRKKISRLIIERGLNYAQVSLAIGKNVAYIQQFIKMQFSRYTSDEYYLVWDSDTIPVKDIAMFSRTPPQKPYFDIKTEFHQPYFTTISKLFPDVKRQVNASFISEHMLINARYMREMIDEIENNTELQGENFQEKIII